MKALVTGGTGFLGQHLVERLLLEGDDVSVLARSGRAGRRGAGGARALLAGRRRAGEREEGGAEPDACAEPAHRATARAISPARGGSTMQAP